MVSVLDSTRSIPNPLLSIDTKEGTQPDFLFNPHARYMKSSLTYRNLADSLQRALLETDKHFVLRALVTDFLDHVEKRNPCEQRLVINFIKNLTTLARADVDGVERLLINAFDAETKPNQTMIGCTVEANTAVTLLNNGFTVSSLSVREFSLGNKKIELRSSDRKRREIDIIAKKEINGETITFFIEVKSSIETLKDKENANNQIKALVELATKFNAVPVVILKTARQTFWRNGAIKKINYLTPDHKEVINFLRQHNDLLIWDENGNDIVCENELLK